MEYQPKENFDKDSMPIEQADAMMQASATLEQAQSLIEKEKFLDRMQAIIEKDGPLSDSDKAELDYLQVELAQQESFIPANSKEDETLVLKSSDRANPIIGGIKQIDANINDLPASHRASDVSKPSPRRGEYT